MENPQHKVGDRVRVIEFAHFIAGPFAATLLANFGADVIKVEVPGRGDECGRRPVGRRVGLDGKRARPDYSATTSRSRWA